MYSIERTRSRRLSRLAVLGRAEQALQAAAQVGGLADVGLGLRIGAAEEEDRGRSGDGGESFGVAVGDELEALGQHGFILVRKAPRIHTEI